ncbi:MAG: family 20 glycosylhydrolase, partial [Gammaproteobacteria bacterium]
EFVQLLRLAAEHHVNIILELNLPGHANAMIRAMAASGRYQVLDPEDKSIHRSAQGYTHNVMNVCLPGTYALAADILETIAGYYKQAGVPLRALHLGGDEVPAGAWLDSPVVRQSSIWDTRWQLDNEADRAAATQALSQHYASEITKLAAAIMPGVKLGFWHEMSPALPADADTYVTGWTTETGDRDLVEAVLDRGQRLVIANASFLYLDMPYTLSSEEPGLPWAAYIDESLIYHFSPLANWAITEGQRDQVLGLQAQLWSETIYSEERMFYHLFPRLLSVAERAWATENSTRNWSGFASALGERELSYLESLNIPFRVPPPGADIVADKIEACTAFPGLVIRYTLDGSEPDSTSMTYNTPVTSDTADVLKMAAFTLSGKTRSRTTTLPGDF